MRINDYSVFKDNIVQEHEKIVISEKINVCSKIQKDDSLFLTRKTLIETIEIIKENPDLKLFRLFNDKFNDDGKAIEEGRIKFLSINRFPDGCFLLVDAQNKKIKCYICELKHFACENIKLIAEQFYSGYLHCKVFLDAIDLENEYEISYEYLIVGYGKESARLEKQLLTHRTAKSPPGVKPEPPHHVKAYQRFKEFNKICFSYMSDYSKSIDFVFEHISLKDKVEELDEEKVELKEKYIVKF